MSVQTCIGCAAASNANCTSRRRAQAHPAWLPWMYGTPMSIFACAFRAVSRARLGKNRPEPLANICLTTATIHGVDAVLNNADEWRRTNGFSRQRFF
jgi:hypothetical protein